MSIWKEIIEATTDKGYIKGEDMVECLENGIVPHVILLDGQDTYELEVSCEEAGKWKRSKNVCLQEKYRRHTKV